MVTVPVLHLLTRDTPAGGASTGNAPTGEVPAELTGLTPIPADAARQIVSTQSVLHRILTDPVTGTVLDETRTDLHHPGQRPPHSDGEAQAVRSTGLHTHRSALPG
jgi:hypothetical protein